MDTQRHQKELEAYYQTQIGGRTIFWKDKYKPYLSLYRDRLIKRNAAILASLPQVIDFALDLGCGQGDLMAVLAPRSRHVLGIDYAEVMARTARSNLSEFPNTFVLCSPAEVLPVKSESLDVILLADVIEHLRDPLQCLCECRRILKPGGRLVITTPNRAVENFWKGVDGTLAAPFRIFRNRRPTPPVFERLFSRGELSNLAQEADFQIVGHRLIEFYPGSEGSGTFGRLLRLIARTKPVREWLIEPVFRALFAGAERFEILNNRQLLVAVKQ